MLSRFSVDPATDGPLTVMSECTGAIGCATCASRAPSPSNPNRHCLVHWWAKHGASATVRK
eukprot:9429545-Pyramimonas_sp.AAC.1